MKFRRERLKEEAIMKRASARVVILSILIALVFHPVFSSQAAQQTQKAQPAAKAEKAEKTEPKLDLKGFDEFAAKLLADWKVPGMAISVVKGGKVIYAQGFGMRDVKLGLKVTPHTLFAIGSCSKAFTAADMGILVDEGKVAWDKPVRTYLPAFKLYDEYAAEHMTLRDLLSHRSGLPRHDFVWYGASFSRKQLFDRLQYLEPNKDFRQLWQYQNLMVMTAGYLVGEVAGMSWEDFTRKKIMEPLGMKVSNFSVKDSQKTPDYALPYNEKKDKIEVMPFRNIDEIGPAGSINSNVMDMANWVLLNLAKGKFGDKQIVSEASMAQIHSPQMVVQQPLQYKEVLYPSYGMGWMIVPYRGHLMLQHGGGIDGFSALVCFMPQDDFGIVILTNKGGTPLTSILNYNICDRLLGLDQIDWSTRIKDAQKKARDAADKAKKEADKDRKVGTKPSHPLEEYVGDYEHPGYGVITIGKAGDALKVKFNSLEGDLRHYHYDVFEIAGEDDTANRKIAFFADLKGNVNSLSVQLEPSVKDIVFTRTGSKAMSEKSFLEKFVGQYDFGGVVATVALKGDNTLTLTVPGQPVYELVPYRGTEFNLKGMQGYSVEFKTDASGKVTEMVSHQPNGAFTAKKK
jgi:CubicO group peptidase (beta-lactamase class C family)